MNQRDHTAAFAEAFFIANLLFVGIFYVALWGLYFLRYQQATTITKQHLSQALIASSISTSLFAMINAFIMLTDGYASLTALFCLEFYFMLIVPVFLVAGIIGFTKAIKGISVSYPLIGRYAT
ncbi:MAG: hypothetical protein P1P93_09305 [Gammaproteobacteria bacterium]|nr:hypothetical protein [Gammaproteobacteria bacterium]